MSGVFRIIIIEINVSFRTAPKKKYIYIIGTLITFLITDRKVYFKVINFDCEVQTIRVGAIHWRNGQNMYL